MTIIRPCVESDVADITRIYAHHVLHGTGTFELTPPSEADMRARHADVLAKSLPFLVVEQAAQVQGFAYCNWFKPRPAFRYSAEDSIYLAPNAAGQGVGRWLLQELIAQSERAGIRKLIAVIGDSANASSIGVHRSCGFQHVGVLGGCGWKFDRWLDVVLMERSVGPGDFRNCTTISTMKYKTAAVWLALVAGPVGGHRWYLYGRGDLGGRLLALASIFGVYGVYRIQTFGLDDQASAWLVPLWGLVWAGCALTAIVYGLRSTERWNAQFNPQAPADARAGATHWFAVLGVVVALGAGATVLLASLAFAFQRYFELTL